MSIWRLVFQEAWHRRWSLLVQLAGVLVASAAVMAATMILRDHDLRSEQALLAKQQALREQMATMEDEYRKITVRMGFNILILPKDAQLEDFYAQDYASSWMSESAAQTLAASKLITVQHLLPVLQQKVKWPERNRTILLVGASGELAPAGSASKQPILQPVPPGSALAGHELHRSLGLKVGQSLTLMGRSFKVAACLPERGTRDDITLWIPLADAQELLDRKGLINCIMALECECGMGDVAVVRQELGKLLPDTRIVELAGNALARAEARRQAHRDATELLAREAGAREQSRLARQQLATTLVTTTVGVCGLWVALAAWANVRSRRGEMGILRALGVSGPGVLALVLGRAVLTGLVGAVLGIVAGTIAGAYGANLPWQNLVLWMVPCAVLAAAPVLSVLAAWIPALVACQIDPAVALREE